jgi:hypothetical protein
MKKSQRITLTVVAAMGLAAGNAQTPAASVVDPNDCATAKANGTPLPSHCKAKGENNIQHGGFGATAKGHTGGS